MFLFEGTLDRSATGLYTHVDRGRPLLVLNEIGGAMHYVLVIGYDPHADDLVLFDPIRGRVLVPASSFAREWEPARRFTVLAVPPA